jgi:hypothetical protein
MTLTTDNVLAQVKTKARVQSLDVIRGVAILTKQRAGCRTPTNRRMRLNRARCRRAVSNPGEMLTCIAEA